MTPDPPTRGTETVSDGASGRKPNKPKVGRERLDALLVARGLAPTRERARALILAGEARVDGRMLDKAGTLVAPDAAIELVGPAAELRYVSRGGLKLAYALDAFGLDPAGCVCLDVGASTGGFTDVLLRRGAARVYALDVGHGQLAWSLRGDPRVVVMERTNIRQAPALPEPVNCAVIDVSFISLRLALPRVAALLSAGGWVVALVKPQFEAGKAEADRGGGVITDRAVHERVLRELFDWLARWGDHDPDTPSLLPKGLAVSPIAGREGNREYLLELVASSAPGSPPADSARAAAPKSPVAEGIHGPGGVNSAEQAIAAAVAAAFAGPAARREREHMRERMREQAKDRSDESGA